MKENKKDTRRQFLRNASLAILSVGALPQLLKANESKGTPNKKTQVEATQTVTATETLTATHLDFFFFFFFTP